MTDQATPPRASFRSFEESTRDDWMLIMEQRRELEAALAARILEQFEHLRDDYGGFPVDRLEHSVQTATRAERDGRDDEYVLCALL
ncbi:MAG: phosphohydrolase, partial [Actinomycetota bacterium]|nr:phosphohydrolase [Actinomycetota bacterium]